MALRPGLALPLKARLRSMLALRSMRAFRLALPLRSMRAFRVPLLSRSMFGARLALSLCSIRAWWPTSPSCLTRVLPMARSLVLSLLLKHALLCSPAEWPPRAMRRRARKCRAMCRRSLQSLRASLRVPRNALGSQRCSHGKVVAVPGAPPRRIATRLLRCRRSPAPACRPERPLAALLGSTALRTLPGTVGVTAPRPGLAVQLRALLRAAFLWSRPQSARCEQ